MLPEKIPLTILDMVGLIEDFQRLLDFLRTAVSALEVEGSSLSNTSVAQLLRQAWGTSTVVRPDLAAQLARFRRGQKYLLYNILRALGDDERWENLSARPQEFNHELEEIMNLAKKFMRARYGVPSHRPTKQAVRDARIGLLRQEGLPFPEIARRLGLSTGNCHLAHDRFKEREARARESMNKIMTVIGAHPELAKSVDEPPEAFT